MDIEKEVPHSFFSAAPLSFLQAFSTWMLGKCHHLQQVFFCSVRKELRKFGILRQGDKADAREDEQTAKQLRGLEGFSEKQGNDHGVEGDQIHGNAGRRYINALESKIP